MHDLQQKHLRIQVTKKVWTSKEVVSTRDNEKQSYEIENMWTWKAVSTAGIHNFNSAKLGKRICDHKKVAET